MALATVELMQLKEEAPAPLGTLCLWQNLVADVVAQCISPELLERQAKNTLYRDESAAPIQARVDITLGALEKKGEKPRLSFIDNPSRIGTGTKIDAGVQIGNEVSIGSHVEIGPGTILRDYVTVEHGARIGQAVLAEEGSIISIQSTVPDHEVLPQGGYTSPGI